MLMTATPLLPPYSRQQDSSAPVLPPLHGLFHPVSQPTLAPTPQHEAYMLPPPPALLMGYSTPPTGYSSGVPAVQGLSPTSPMTNCDHSARAYGYGIPNSSIQNYQPYPRTYQTVVQQQQQQMPSRTSPQLIETPHSNSSPALVDLRAATCLQQLQRASPAPISHSGTPMLSPLEPGEGSSYSYSPANTDSRYGGSASEVNGTGPMSIACLTTDQKLQSSAATSPSTSDTVKGDSEGHCDHKDNNSQSGSKRSSSNSGVAPSRKRARANASNSRGNTSSNNHDSRERPYICDQCGRGFSRPNDVFRHQKSHRDDSTFRCPFYTINKLCHVTGGFSRGDTFKNHLRSIHFRYPQGTKKKDRFGTPGTCPVCDEAFSNVDIWISQHIMKNKCPYLCEHGVRVGEDDHNHSDRTSRQYSPASSTQSSCDNNSKESLHLKAESTH